VTGNLFFHIVFFFLGTEHSLHGANRKSPPAAAGHGQSLEPEGQRFGQGGRDCCVGAVRIYGLIEPLCCCMHGTPVRYVIPQIRKKKSLRRQGILVVTRAGTTPCYLKTGHGMVFGTEHGTIRNILSRASTTRTRGPYCVQNLDTAGYMARPASCAVLGAAWHKNGT
jgi:hypothetical protein